jgi:hypothetical protein
VGQIVPVCFEGEEGKALRSWIIQGHMTDQS